jgi:hypothetical protein
MLKPNTLLFPFLYLHMPTVPVTHADSITRGKRGPHLRLKLLSDFAVVELKQPVWPLMLR